MPAWPGGPCPHCGESMPENLIHCQNCRALLNPDLESDSVEVPEFVPLQEIDTVVEVQPEGYFVQCPDCHQELRIRRKYVGQRVQCKLCRSQFPLELASSSLELVAYFAACPHCSEELRAATKYHGKKVACKYCGGEITFVEHSA